MLDKLSIARKIAISFSVLLLQLLLVVGGGFAGLQIIGGLFVDYREAANATIAINQISDQVTSLRQIEGLYRFRSEAIEVTSFKEVRGATAEAIEKQRALHASEPAAQEGLGAVSAQLAEFTDAFARSVVIQEERSTILATMEQHATAGRNALQDVLSAATTANHTPSVVKASSGSEAMLKMLLLAEEYVRTGDPADFEKIPSLAMWSKQVIKGLVPLLKMSLPDVLERGKVALAEIDPYLEAARALKDSTERRNAVWAEMDALGPAMSQALDGLKGGVAELQSGMGATADATRATLSSVVLAVGVLSILIGAVLAFRIGGGLSRSIRRMAADMQRIAQGELDLAVDARQASGELGLMAGALQVFKVNGEAVRNAAEERAAVAQAEARRLETQSALQAGVARVVDAAVSGDFSQRIAGPFEAPDLQRLAERINRLMQTVDEGVNQTAAVMSAFARSDLTRRMDGHFEGAFAVLQRDINLAAETFSGIVGHIQTISRALKAATGEILAGANDLSERTTRQAATIEETSAAIETMAEQVTLSAEQAETASSKSDHAVTLADEGGQTILAATQAMDKISDSSMQISGIIGLIDDIAFQTNLLALNASVEAARAGEAGKGFAVVAVEVRRLAQSAAEASSQVKALIEQSVFDVQRGENLVAEADRKLQQILSAVRENGAHMRRIAADSRNQAVAIRDISSAVSFMDEMTQHNAALVEETNAAIEQTEAQASELDDIVRTFVLADTVQELAA